MKVRELPQSEQDHLRELMPEEWSVIRDLEIEELSLYAQAKLDDANTRLERTQQRLAVEEAITELVRPLVASVGDLPLCKLAQFLRRDERQRYEALMRELKELSRPVKVMHGREAWHQAVEDAVPDGPQAYPSLEMLAQYLDRVTHRVMLQNLEWPRERVRTYARYLLESASGIELPD